MSPSQIPKDKDGDNGRSIIKLVYDTKDNVILLVLILLKSYIGFFHGLNSIA